MIIFLLIIFSLGDSYGYIDHLGTLGGMLGGLFIGLSVIPVINGGDYEKHCKYLER